MQFIDKVTIRLKAGNGGDGIVSFRREKYVPLGGPNGGDGGSGASIVFEADNNRNTLLDLRYTKMIKGENGAKGEPNNRYGQSRADVVVKVPVGTIVKDLKNGEVIADLNQQCPGRNLQRRSGWKGQPSLRDCPQFRTGTRSAGRKR